MSWIYHMKLKTEGMVVACSLPPLAVQHTLPLSRKKPSPVKCFSYDLRLVLTISRKVPSHFVSFYFIEQHFTIFKIFRAKGIMSILNFNRSQNLFVFNIVPIFIFPMHTRCRLLRPAHVK